MAKSAREQLETKKSAKKVVVEKNFGGIKKGDLMLVATPQIVADYIKRIPYGHTRTALRIRADLAKRRGCAGTCPMSTAIFIRIAAAAAIEDMKNGAATDDVIPFWRLVAPDDKVVSKLDIDSAWIAAQREAEKEQPA